MDEKHDGEEKPSSDNSRFKILYHADADNAQIASQENAIENLYPSLEAEPTDFLPSNINIAAEIRASYKPEQLAPILKRFLTEVICNEAFQKLELVQQFSTPDNSQVTLASEQEFINILSKLGGPEFSLKLLPFIRELNTYFQRNHITPSTEYGIALADLARQFPVSLSNRFRLPAIALERIHTEASAPPVIPVTQLSPIPVNETLAKPLSCILKKMPDSDMVLIKNIKNQAFVFTKIELRRMLLEEKRGAFCINTLIEIASLDTENVELNEAVFELLDYLDGTSQKVVLATPAPNPLIIAMQYSNDAMISNLLARIKKLESQDMLITLTDEVRTVLPNLSVANLEAYLALLPEPVDANDYAQALSLFIENDKMDLAQCMMTKLESFDAVQKAAILSAGNPNVVMQVIEKRKLSLGVHLLNIINELDKGSQKAILDKTLNEATPIHTAFQHATESDDDQFVFDTLVSIYYAWEEPKDFINLLTRISDIGFYNPSSIRKLGIMSCGQPPELVPHYNTLRAIEAVSEKHLKLSADQKTALAARWRLAITSFNNLTTTVQNQIINLNPIAAPLTKKAAKSTALETRPAVDPTQYIVSKDTYDTLAKSIKAKDPTLRPLRYALLDLADQETDPSAYTLPIISLNTVLAADKSGDEPKILKAWLDTMEQTAERRILLARHLPELLEPAVLSKRISALKLCIERIKLHLNDVIIANSNGFFYLLNQSIIESIKTNPIQKESLDLLLDLVMTLAGYQIRFIFNHRPHVPKVNVREPLKTDRRLLLLNNLPFNSVDELDEVRQIIEEFDNPKTSYARKAQLAADCCVLIPDNPISANLRAACEEVSIVDLIPTEIVEEKKPKTNLTEQISIEFRSTLRKIKDNLDYQAPSLNEILGKQLTNLRNHKNDLPFQNLSPDELKTLLSQTSPTTTSRDLFAGSSSSDASRLRGQAAERRLDVEGQISDHNLINTLLNILCAKTYWNNLYPEPSVASFLDSKVTDDETVQQRLMAILGSLEWQKYLLKAQPFSINFINNRGESETVSFTLLDQLLLFPTEFAIETIKTIANDLEESTIIHFLSNPTGMLYQVLANSPDKKAILIHLLLTLPENTRHKVLKQYSALKQIVMEYLNAEYLNTLLETAETTLSSETDQERFVAISDFLKAVLLYEPEDTINLLSSSATENTSEDKKYTIAERLEKLLLKLDPETQSTLWNNLLNQYPTLNTLLILTQIPEALSSNEFQVSVHTFMHALISSPESGKPLDNLIQLLLNIPYKQTEMILSNPNITQAVSEHLEPESMNWPNFIAQIQSFNGLRATFHVLSKLQPYQRSNILESNKEIIPRIAEQLARFKNYEHQQTLYEHQQTLLEELDPIWRTRVLLQPTMESVVYQPAYDWITSPKWQETAFKHIQSIASVPELKSMHLSLVDNFSAGVLELGAISRESLKAMLLNDEKILLQLFKLRAQETNPRIEQAINACLDLIDLVGEPSKTELLQQTDESGKTVLMYASSSSTLNKDHHLIDKILQVNNPSILLVQKDNQDESALAYAIPKTGADVFDYQVFSTLLDAYLKDDQLFIQSASILSQPTTLLQRAAEHSSVAMNKLLSSWKKFEFNNSIASSFNALIAHYLKHNEASNTAHFQQLLDFMTEHFSINLASPESFYALLESRDATNRSTQLSIFLKKLTLTAILEQQSKLMQPFFTKSGLKDPRSLELQNLIAKADANTQRDYYLLALAAKITELLGRTINQEKTRIITVARDLHSGLTRIIEDLNQNPNYQHRSELLKQRAKLLEETATAIKSSRETSLNTIIGSLIQACQKDNETQQSSTLQSTDGTLKESAINQYYLEQFTEKASMAEISFSELKSLVPSWFTVPYPSIVTQVQWLLAYPRSGNKNTLIRLYTEYPTLRQNLLDLIRTYPLDSQKKLIQSGEDFFKANGNNVGLEQFQKFMEAKTYEPDKTMRDINHSALEGLLVAAGTENSSFFFNIFRTESLPSLEQQMEEINRWINTFHSPTATTDLPKINLIDYLLEQNSRDSTALIRALIRYLQTLPLETRLDLLNLPSATQQASVYINLANELSIQREIEALENSLPETKTSFGKSLLQSIERGKKLKFNYYLDKPIVDNIKILDEIRYYTKHQQFIFMNKLLEDGMFSNYLHHASKALGGREIYDQMVANLALLQLNYLIYQYEEANSTSYQEIIKTLSSINDTLSNQDADSNEWNNALTSLETIVLPDIPEKSLNLLEPFTQTPIADLIKKTRSHLARLSIQLNQGNTFQDWPQFEHALINSKKELLTILQDNEYTSTEKQSVLNDYLDALNYYYNQVQQTNQTPNTRVIDLTCFAKPLLVYTMELGSLNSLLPIMNQELKATLLSQTSTTDGANVLTVLLNDKTQKDLLLEVAKQVVNMELNLGTQVIQASLPKLTKENLDALRSQPDNDLDKKYVFLFELVIRINKTTQESNLHNAYKELLEDLLPKITTITETDWKIAISKAKVKIDSLYPSSSGFFSRSTTPPKVREEIDDFKSLISKTSGIK